MGSTYVTTAPKFSNEIAKGAFEIMDMFKGEAVVVYFTKRTDGQRRRMVCTYGEQPLLTRRSWDPSSKNLLQVFDCEKGDWRFVSMDAVEKIVVSGTTLYPTLAQELAARRPSHILALDIEKLNASIEARNRINALLGY